MTARLPPRNTLRPMAPTVSVIDISGVTKNFKLLRALDGANLRVDTGEIYGLLGPNGSGKSTLIRAIVGLVRPDAGTVTVLGRRMPDLAVLNDIGYMTQQAALYPESPCATCSERSSSRIRCWPRRGRPRRRRPTRRSPPIRAGSWRRRSRWRPCPRWRRWASRWPAVRSASW